MTNEQKQVQEFMQTFGQETPATPCIPSLEVRKLRAKLILEEALETIEALGFPFYKQNNEEMIRCIEQASPNEIKECNLIEVADGLADLHYVAYCGTALACGLNMEPIFQEVHRSNMSKLWTNNELQCLIQTNPSIDYTWKCLDENAHIKAKIFLTKDKDGKVIKSPSYSPANLAPIIEAQKNP